MTDSTNGSFENKELKDLFEAVASGDTSPQEALQKWPALGFTNLSFARLDLDRKARLGYPEVIFGEGKTPEQIIMLARQLDAAGQNVFCTRVEQEVATKVRRHIEDLEYNSTARTLMKINEPPLTEFGQIGVVSAGTADQHAAQEALDTCLFMGIRARPIDDVGIAGLHRLLTEMDAIRECDVLIVVAGMEGALPSVIAGLVDIPVIAVPTSAGYGASFDGLAALLAMLNSCSPGVSVVNIDNGFGAAIQASLIARRIPGKPQ
jgi:NCAIR mutase (PurE)-related protein